MVKLLQEENIRDAKLYIQSYDTTGKVLNDYTVTYTGTDCIGNGIYALLYSYGKKRRLPFSLAPVEHRTFRGVSSQGSATLKRYINATNPPRNKTLVRGDVAAILRRHLPTYDAYAIEELKQSWAVTNAAAAMLEADTDYGMIVAEAAETAKMFVSPFNYLAKKIRGLLRPKTFRRSKRTPFTSKVQYAADAWLGLRYGLLPTISDIGSICETYANVTKPREQIHRKGGGYPGALTGLDEMKTVYYMGVYYHLRSDSFEKRNYVSHIFYSVRDDSWLILNQLGLGLYQLPNIAWELVPFSFILDWGINVSSWLRAMMPDPNYVRKGQTASMTHTRGATVNVMSASLYSKMTYASPLNSLYQWEEVFYTRSINPSLPELPPVRADFMNLQRGIDSASLAFKPVSNCLKQILK